MCYNQTITLAIHAMAWRAEVLERTEALTPDDMARMHGAMRSPRDVPKPTLASVASGGARLAVGDRVRLNPKSGGDIMDLVLAGIISDFGSPTHGVNFGGMGAEWRFGDSSTGRFKRATWSKKAGPVMPPSSMSVTDAWFASANAEA